MTIGNLIMSMIEENTPESLLVAKETKDTLDKEALYRCMASCYEATKSERKKLEGMKAAKPGNQAGAGAQAPPVKVAVPLTPRVPPGSKPEPISQEMKEQYDEVGFVYYLIIARTYDLDPKLIKKEQLNTTPIQLEAYNYYKKNTMSIEVLKDDCLQKINFRVKNKNVLRDEVMEKMTWNVDRSSPSNKIRDLMKWSKDILKDIYYQRKILSNPVATFFTKQWVLWNQIVILLSVALNFLMLYTWNARASMEDVAKNVTTLPESLYDPFPDVDLPEYDTIIWALGGAHNIFSGLVLLTYFLSNHPTLPKISVFVDKIKAILTPKHDEEVEVEKTHESKLEVHFFSVTTFYYLMFVGMSILGTVFKGYFFAFHMLNIVNNNQLLRGVIQAVTQNGKSLVWVAILGLIIFYIYALISFAMMRSSFSPDSHLYCATLWQCTITVIHYGLVGVLFDKVVNHPLDSTFEKFGFYVIYHLSFFIFITTIGLNIIFGIIVDTFSELRDLKWTAERDMRDTCFICSRGSYDFEHHGMGFDHHINNEHNIWAYIFFFIHLHDTKQCDYTSLELYVFRLLAQDKFDFFPLNRALSLSLMDEGSTDSKVDDLLRYIMTLVDRQKEEDAKNKREEERQKQLRWREENRNALLHPGQDDGDQGGGGDSASNQSTSAGQLQRQKRWQQDLKDTKLIQSVDTQDSTTAYVDPRGQTSHHADDLLSQDDTQTGYTKTDTLPLDSRLEGLSRRSSPLSGAGWVAAPQRGMYMSMDKRTGDAPVQSIEFDEDEDHPKQFASPVESHPKSSTSPVESRGYTTIATGSSARLTPVDHLDDYEHLPLSRHDPATSSGASQHLLEKDLRDVATKLLPESQERSRAGDPDPATAPGGYGGVLLPDFSTRYVPSPPSDHSSGSDIGPQSSRPPLSRHDTHMSDPRRPSVAPPGSRRDSFQSISGRLPAQSRRGAEDFGMLTEDPFEITAPTAEFDDGLVRERRPSMSASRRQDDRSSRPDSKPTDV